MDLLPSPFVCWPYSIPCTLWDEGFQFLAGFWPVVCLSFLLKDLLYLAAPNMAGCFIKISEEGSLLLRQAFQPYMSSSWTHSQGHLAHLLYSVATGKSQVQSTLRGSKSHKDMNTLHRDHESHPIVCPPQTNILKRKKVTHFPMFGLPWVSRYLWTLCLIQAPAI